MTVSQVCVIELSLFIPVIKVEAIFEKKKRFFPVLNFELTGHNFALPVNFMSFWLELKGNIYSVLADEIPLCSRSLSKRLLHF